MKTDTLKILHELTDWQVAAALFFYASFKKKSEKRYECLLGNDITVYHEFDDEETYEILSQDSDFYRLKKSILYANCKDADWNMVKYPHMEVMKSIINGFNKKSSENFFRGQIENFPRPRIGSRMEGRYSDNKVYRFSSTLSDGNLLALRSTKWGRNIIRSGNEFIKSSLDSIHDKNHREAVRLIWGYTQMNWNEQFNKTNAFLRIVDSPEQAIVAANRLEKQGFCESAVSGYY